MYVTAKISEGLGNRFFQVAAMLWYAKKYGKKPVFLKERIYENNHPGPHGIEFFFPTIPILESAPEESFLTLEENPSSSLTFIDLPDYDGNVLLSGYFQTWQRVDLEVPTVLLKPFFFKIPNSFFLHVRRGDYLKCPHHAVDLMNYMRRANEVMPSDSNIIVCSDDIDWCKATIPSILSTTRCIFYDGDDYSTLLTMIHCDRGGICANSTFSWWAAYWGFRLDTSRIYTIPSVWCYPPAPPATDIVGPWCTVIPV